MVRTITLKSHTPKLDKVVDLVEEILKDLDGQKPLELYLKINDYKKLERTINTLFDRESVQRIQSCLEHSTM